MAYANDSDESGNRVSSPVPSPPPPLPPSPPPPPPPDDGEGDGVHRLPEEREEPPLQPDHDQPLPPSTSSPTDETIATAPPPNQDAGVAIAPISSSPPPLPVVVVKKEKVTPTVAVEEDQLRQLLERPTVYPPNAPPHPGSRSTGSSGGGPSRVRAGGQQTISSYFGCNNKASDDGKSLEAEDDDKGPAIDLESVRGVFGWTTVEGVHLPFLLRLGAERFTAVRIIERTLLKRYLQALHPDVYSCTYIKSYFITDNEAVLLNEINMRHCDRQFGPEPFTVKDLVVQLDDVEQLYLFLSTCHRKLNHKFNVGTNAAGAVDRQRDDRCGLVSHNGNGGGTALLPYVRRRDGTRYAPLALAELLMAPTEHERKQPRTEKLEPWEMSYIKFCCKVAGIAHDFLEEADSCPAVAVDDLSRRATSFAEWWPASPSERAHLTVAQQHQKQRLAVVTTAANVLNTYTTAATQRKLDAAALLQAATITTGSSGRRSKAESTVGVSNYSTLPRAVPASGYADGTADGSGQRPSATYYNVEAVRTAIGRLIAPSKSLVGKVCDNGVVDFSARGTRGVTVTATPATTQQLCYPNVAYPVSAQRQPNYAASSAQPNLTLTSASPSPQAFIYNGQWWGPVNAVNTQPLDAATCYPTTHYQPLVASTPYAQSTVTGGGSRLHHVSSVTSAASLTTTTTSSSSYLRSSPVAPSPTTPQHLAQQQYAKSGTGSAERLNSPLNLRSSVSVSSDAHSASIGGKDGSPGVRMEASRQSLDRRRSSFTKVNGSSQYPAAARSSSSGNVGNSSSSSPSGSLVYQPPPLIRVPGHRPTQMRTLDFGSVDQQQQRQHQSSFSKPPPPLQVSGGGTRTAQLPQRSSKHGTGLTNGTASATAGYDTTSQQQHQTNGVTYQNLARHLTNASSSSSSGGRESFVVAPGNHHHLHHLAASVVGKLSSPKPANQVPMSVGNPTGHHSSGYQHHHQLPVNGRGQQESRAASITSTLSHAEALSNFLQMHANGVIPGTTGSGQFSFTSKLHEMLLNAQHESQQQQQQLQQALVAHQLQYQQQQQQQLQQQRAGEYRDRRITASPPLSSQTSGRGGGGGHSSGPSYKVQQVMILGTKYRCVNSRPCEFTTALMVPVQELAQNTKPRASLQRCKDILTSVFGVQLFDCNRMQEEVLRKHINGLKEGVPVTLICTDDMIKYLPQLSYTLAKLVDAKEKEREPVSKRPRLETQVNS